jgi:hypothetical protein
MDGDMAKKKRVSIVGRLEKSVSDFANAVSVAATGSEIGILELAAEEELRQRPAKKRKAKPTTKKTKKKKVAAKTPRKPVKRKRAAKRRAR